MNKTIRMNSIQKSSDEPAYTELRSRMSALWKLLRKRPTVWQAPPVEKLEQLEFGFAGSVVSGLKRK